MKRIILLAAILAMVAAVSWSAPLTLTFMDNGNPKFAQGEELVRGFPGPVEKILADFQKANGIRVNVVIRDVSKGSLTFDAMLAAGNPPDVWLDAAGYFTKYMTADYALPLEKYMNLSKFRPDLLALYKVDGHQYVLPIANISTGMAVNLTLLQKAGYELPSMDKWTTDEFMVAAGKLKAAGIPATAIMAKGGLRTWSNIWLRAFGATFFKPGDWSKVVIDSPEARAGLAYIRKMVDAGYTPDPLEINDDDAVEMFTTGKLFSCMMQNGHTDYWFPEQLKQGKIDAIPDYTFIEFPHGPGVKATPVYGYQSGLLAHKAKDETTNKMIAKLVQALSGYELQWYWDTLTGGFPTLKDFSPNIGTAGKPSYQAIAALAPKVGNYQEWPTGERGNELARSWGSLTEQWVRGKLNEDDLLKRFTSEASAILAKK